MALQATETIYFREPRPPEELGADITRTCVSLLEQRDRSFAKVITDGRIFEYVSTALTEYLEKLEAAHPNEVVRAVRVTVNDYFEKLGIGLMSCGVEPLNAADSEESLKLPDEAKSPTIGVIPEIIDEYKKPPRVCAFEVDQGGEELTPLTENLCIRGYIPGEYPRHNELGLQPIPRGHTVLVPQKSGIGCRIKLFDDEKLFLSEFRDRVVPITYDEHRSKYMPERSEPGQVYFCRYLTKEAVRQALGL